MLGNLGFGTKSLGFRIPGLGLMIFKPSRI